MRRTVRFTMLCFFLFLAAAPSPMLPGKRGGGVGTPSPRRKDGHTSPRRREALRRFVSLVKRKAGGKRGTRLPYAAGFRLLHVDVFQASDKKWRRAFCC